MLNFLRNYFVFRGQVSWRKRHIPSQSRENFTYWWKFIPQKNGILNLPSVKTSILHMFCVYYFITLYRCYFLNLLKPNNIYTGCPRRNVPNFGRVFLMLNYTDITQNTYIQSWTITEIMAREKCGLLGCPRTVSRPWRHFHPLRMPGNEKPLANIGMQWPWRDKGQLRPASITWKPKDKYDSSASVFVVQFNGFMSLTS